MKISFKKLNRNFLIFVGIFTLVILSGTVYVVGVGVYSDGFRVNTGSGPQNLTIDAGGTCQTVTNNSGNDIFVPTKTVAEWNAFVANKPGGVTVGSCPVAYSTVSGTVPYNYYIAAYGGANIYGSGNNFYFDCSCCVPCSYYLSFSNSTISGPTGSSCAPFYFSGSGNTLTIGCNYWSPVYYYYTINNVALSGSVDMRPYCSGIGEPYLAGLVGEGNRIRVNIGCAWEFNYTGDTVSTGYIYISP